jgi:acetylornithine deacetylase/succinyl-diaminopimelate desuccinylase-like protein
MPGGVRHRPKVCSAEREPDGRQFAKLGIQTYGFLPYRIDHDWVSTIHAADERIPVRAIEECTRGLAMAATRMLM